MTRNTVDGGFSPTTYRGLSSDNNIVILVTRIASRTTTENEAYVAGLAALLTETGNVTQTI